MRRQAFRNDNINRQPVTFMRSIRLVHPVAALALAPFGVATDAAVGAGMLHGLYALAQSVLGTLAFGLPKAGK